MSNGFGRHFSADLYFCQNDLWNSPKNFYDGIYQVTRSLNVINDSWSLMRQVSGNILIIGEFNDSLVLIQVFPVKNFLTMDIFCWQPQINLHHFSEGLIELFAPQVVAAETRLRGEHLN